MNFKIISTVSGKMVLSCLKLIANLSICNLFSCNIWQMQAIDAPKVILAIEYEKDPEVQEKRPPSPPPPEPEAVKVETPAVQPPDLLVYFFYNSLVLR